MNHDWQFTSASGASPTGFQAVVIAVCAKCGVMRAEEAPRGSGEEGRIDLTGDCAGDGRRSAYANPPPT